MRYKSTNRLKVKGWERCALKTRTKGVPEAGLVSDKLDIKAKTFLDRTEMFYDKKLNPPGRYHHSEDIRP